MKNERTFLRCGVCGNLVGLIEDAGVPIICCGQEMEAIQPNTADASKEKHVPVAKIEGETLTVTVGSAPHPMTSEHHIAWIMVAQGPLTQRITLDRDVKAEATFCVCKGDFTVYAYCNLHGLWAAEVANP